MTIGGNIGAPGYVPTDGVQIGTGRDGHGIVIPGRPRVFYLATCRECNHGRRPLPMPFGTEQERDTWAAGHRTTGHHVDEAIEIRPRP